MVSREPYRKEAGSNLLGVHEELDILKAGACSLSSAIKTVGEKDDGDIFYLRPPLDVVYAFLESGAEIGTATSVARPDFALILIV